MPSEPAAHARRTAPTARTVLTAADLEAALALSGATGWNQTADDWSFFVDQGAIGERDAATGRVVATAASLVHGRFGWISMVLVAAERRHQGLASRLVEASIETVRARGAIPVLDATPAGRPVYAALGFEGDLGFERWERAATGAGVEGDGTAAAAADGVDAGVRPAPADASDAAPTPRADASAGARIPPADASAAARIAGAAASAAAPTPRADPVDRDRPDDLADLAGIDLDTSGLARPEWWADVARRAGTRAVRDGDGGFALVRAGRRALQLGPVVARDGAAATALVDAALAATGGAAVFVDVPDARPALAHHLAGAGFVRQRPFTRMALGAAPPPLGARQFAFAGPEYG